MEEGCLKHLQLGLGWFSWTPSYQICIFFAFSPQFWAFKKSLYKATGRYQPREHHSYHGLSNDSLSVSCHISIIDCCCFPAPSTWLSPGHQPLLYWQVDDRSLFPGLLLPLVSWVWTGSSQDFFPLPTINFSRARNWQLQEKAHWIPLSGRCTFFQKSLFSGNIHVVSQFSYPRE